MTLKQYRDYFRDAFGWTHAISSGKIDDSEEIAVCFLNSEREIENIQTYGGAKKGYNLKAITILLRYTKDADEAEEMAVRIQDFFHKKSFLIGEQSVFAHVIYNEPIWIGANDDGVCQYSFEIDFIEKI